MTAEATLGVTSSVCVGGDRKGGRVMQRQGSGVFGGHCLLFSGYLAVNPLDTGALGPLEQAWQREVGRGSLGTQQAVSRE